MAEKFKATQRADLLGIHGGYKYESGDVVDVDAINAPIEASAYAQELAIDAKNIAEDARNYVKGTQTGVYPALAAYPVGAIYITAIDDDPARRFGGEWVQIEDMFLLAAGNDYIAGNYYGSESHTHGYSKLRADMTYTSAVGTGAIVMRTTQNPSNAMWKPTHYFNIDKNEMPSSNTYETNWGVDLSGQLDPASNIPPSIAVYVWKRTK